MTTANDHGHVIRFASQMENLSDIELAVLLCLIAGQHCIIESDLELQHALSEELQLVRIH